MQRTRKNGSGGGSELSCDGTNHSISEIRLSISACVHSQACTQKHAWMQAHIYPCRCRLHICLAPALSSSKASCNSPVFVFLSKTAPLRGLHEDIFAGALVWVRIYLHWVGGWGRPGTGNVSPWHSRTFLGGGGGEDLPMVPLPLLCPPGEDKQACQVFRRPCFPWALTK